jgi:hypothetical protein
MRRWSVMFGLAYARRLRRSYPSSDTRWHLEDGRLSIDNNAAQLEEARKIA